MPSPNTTRVRSVKSNGVIGGRLLWLTAEPRLELWRLETHAIRHARGAGDRIADARARRCRIRRRRSTGRSGADRTPPASRRPPIRRSSGARRRTSAGRSRFPAADPARRSIWGDRVFVLTAVPVGVDGAAAHAPRGGVRPRVPHRFVVMALDRKTGKDDLGAHGARGHAARGLAPAVGHLCLVVRDDRRPARLRLLRLVRPLRLRHGRQAALGEGSRRQEDAAGVRRGADAGPLRQPHRRRSGITRDRRSSPRSTSATGDGAVADRARRRSTAGARRSSSSRAAARR